MASTGTGRLADVLDEHTLVASPRFWTRAGDSIHECSGMECATDIARRLAERGVQLEVSRAGMVPRVDDEEEDDGRHRHKAAAAVG